MPRVVDEMPDIKWDFRETQKLKLELVVQWDESKGRTEDPYRQLQLHSSSKNYRCI